jgi:type IV pilus assembly protein PilN
MICINLLKEEGPIRQKAKAIAFAYILSIVTTVIACFSFSNTKSAELEKLIIRRDQLDKIVAELNNQTKDIAEVNNKKQELRERLMVIAKLKKSKIGPVQVLDQLNMALPERSWLTQISEGQDGMRISGITLDNETTSMIIRELQKSEFFTDVRLAVSQQSESNSVKIYQFMIDAKIRYEGDLLESLKKDKPV